MQHNDSLSLSLSNRALKLFSNKTFIRSAMIIFCAGFFVLGFGAKASAATYYVSPSGSNTSPYDTWAKAAPNPQLVLTAFDLNPGDIIELDGGVSGISYSSIGTAIINPDTNDAGVIIKGSVEGGHNGLVTIDGTVNTNAAVNISAGRTEIVIQNMRLKPGNGKYAILDYAQTTLIDLTLDGSASNQRLILLSGTSGGFTTTGTRLKLTDCTSPNFCIYIISGASFTLSSSLMSGGWGSVGGSNDAYIMVDSGSSLVSNNNSYTDLPLGAFQVTGAGSTVTSNNDMLIGLNRLYGPTTLGMFKTLNSGTITINNPFYITGGRAPGATYVTAGTRNIAINNSITNVLPEVIHHKQKGLVSIVIDTSVKSYVEDSIAQGDSYGIPISFAINKNSLMAWEATEDAVKAKLLSLTQGPHLNHEFLNHTISHPHLTDPQAFIATYSGAGTGTIVVGGAYPAQIVTVISNGVTVSTLDTTITSYGTNHRNLSTILGLRLAIDDLLDWETSVGTSIVYDSTGGFSSSLKLGTTTITTGTTVPFDISTNYYFWHDQIVGMTTWIESFMGVDYVKSFVIPFALRDGYDYSAVWQTWMNANIATTHAGGARTMESTEQTTSPLSTMIPNNLSQIMGIGTVDTGYIFMPEGVENITEEQVRQRTRSIAVWAAETGALMIITVHELGCNTVQLGYVLDELAKAQAEGIITIKTFNGLVDYIRTSGLWTDAGNGQWNRTYTDQSNYHLKATSSAIDAGVDVALTTDFSNNPIYGTPDIGAYEYQPTHTMVASVNDPQIGEAIRVYGDGKFRNTIDDSDTNATDTAKLSIVPQSSATTKWIDLNISTWNTSGNHEKTWTENGDNLDHATNTLHTIGDLIPSTVYTIKIDGTQATGANLTGSGCTNGVCTTDGTGQIAFTYTGGYSSHTFDITDTTAPAFSDIIPIAGANVSGDDTITFTDSETTTPQCSLDNSHWDSCTTGVTSFSQLTGWDSIPEKNTFILYLKDTDAANNTGTAEVDNLTKADTVAPIRSDGAPTGELDSDTTSTTISLKTDENATCKYDTSSKDYADMNNTFTTTGATNHAQAINNLTTETSYTYYVRCKDGSQNANDTDYLISFSVDTKNETNDSDDNNGNNSRNLNVHKVASSATSNSITINWKTDYNTKDTVFYGTDKNLKHKKQDQQKTKKHTLTIKNLTPDTTYYFKIKSEDNSDNQDTSRIHEIKTQAVEASIEASKVGTEVGTSNVQGTTPPQPSPDYRGGGNSPQVQSPQNSSSHVVWWKPWTWF